MASELEFVILLDQWPPESCPIGDMTYEGVSLALQLGEDLQMIERGAAQITVPVRLTRTGTEYAAPEANGKTGEKFVYLAWLHKTGIGMKMFRRIKVTLPYPVITGTKTVRLRLTDLKGQPTCATPKPPLMVWEP